MRISIITPNFNGVQFLEKTIQSVLDQGYPKLEYIIIDGGSTDGSIEIIKKYQKHLTYWVSEPDRGQTHAINKGIAKSTGEIISWINSDDYYLPNVLNTIAGAYTNKQWNNIVFGHTQIVNAQGQIKKTISPVVLSANQLNPVKCIMYQPSSFFTRNMYERFGPFDENLHYAMDMDFWIRLFYSGNTIYSIDEKLSAFRRHADAKSSLGNLPFIVDLINKYEKNTNAFSGVEKILNYYYEQYLREARLDIKYLRTLLKLKKPYTLKKHRILRKKIKQVIK